jgi:hypothetical protein
MNWIDTHAHLTILDYPDPIEAVSTAAARGRHC